MKECPYCHLENPDQAKYCLACGRKLTDEKPRLLRVFKNKIRPEEKSDEKQLTNPETETPKDPEQHTVEETGVQDSAALKEETAPAQNDDFNPEPAKTPDPDAEFFEKELAKEKESKNLLGRLFAGDHVDSQAEYQPLSSRFQPDISSVDLETEERRRKEEQERREKQEQEARMSMMPGAQRNDKQKMILMTVICLLSCLVVILGLIVMTQSARNSSSRPHTPTSTSSMKRYFDDDYTDDWKESSSNATTFEEITDEEGWDLDDEDYDDSGEFIEDIISDDDPEPGYGYGDVYQTQFVMKVRSQPSLDAGTVGSLSAGEKVEIDETRTDDNGATWGHLADQSGWVCIRDRQQTYLAAEN